MNVFSTLTRLVVASCLVSASASLKGDDSLANTFLSEAPQAWREMENTLLHCEGELLLEAFGLTSGGGRIRRYAEEVRFMLNGSDHRRTEAVDLDSGVVSAGCRNSGESFWVKGYGDFDTNYKLERMSDSVKTAWGESRVADDHMWRVAPLIYGPFALKDIPLREVVKSETFKLNSISRLADTLEIYVEFDYTPPSGDLWQVAVWFNPDNNWAVNQYKINQPFGKTGGESVVSIQYDTEQGVAKSFLPSKVLSTFGEPEKLRLQSENWELGRLEMTLASFESKEVPEENFKLKAFGVSPPAAANTWLWLAVIGGLGSLLIVAGLSLARAPSTSKSGS